MARTDDEREIRLRPPKPRLRRNEAAAWSSGFRLLMHYARTSRNAGNRAAAGGKTRSIPAYHQRCAVRVTYLNNRTRGQWKAHGRYLARESATFESGAKGAGFGRGGDGIDLTETLQRWQAEGDERLWKLIISPELGDRVDLSRLTRDLVQHMENDLGTELEWAAVEHHNTEHPHVHIALRGRRDDGDALRLNRQFIQSRIREIAGDLCTRQLGYRTERDAQEAERREITEARLTSLDRLPIEVLDPASMTSLEGRVLVHGQDENSGRNYLMLEGTDAKVYFIHYTREMEEARSRGELRANSFVRLKKLAATRPLMDVIDLGDAERLLTNPIRLGEIARECIKRGIAPVEEGWGGWLGRYQAALGETVREVVERRTREAIRVRQRGKDRSRRR